jgi:hypothetical protein
MQALLEALEHEADPVRRSNLEVVARHIDREVAGDVEGILGTLVAEPVYTISGASTSRGPQGAAEVRAFYEDLVATGKNRFEFRIDRVVADTRTVVTEGEFRFAYPGRWLPGRLLDDGTPAADDGWYLVAYRAVVLWPVADSGLIEGEDIYAGEAPRILRRLASGELPHLGPPGR